MDINNNQQINTFTKGMNTDTSDAFIGADQYRYAENLRISTDTNSSGGSLVPIDGTVAINDYNGTCDWDNIIAVTSARDMLIVVGVKKINGLNYMQVYEYNTTNEELLDVLPKSWRAVLVEGTNPSGMLLGNDSSVPTSISTVVRWESDHNVKLYIADGVHTMMVIRLDRLTDVDEAESTQDSSGVLLSPPTISLAQEYTGDVRAAKVQYVYRFYTQGVAATGLSPISEQLILYKDESHGFGIDGDEGPSTGKAVYVEIPSESIAAILAQNSSINAVLIYRIAYLLTGHDPKIDLIYDGEIVSWDGVDRGLSYGTITMEELLSYIASLTRPHEIESKGDYLFLANISYVKDGVDNKFKDIDTTAPSIGGDEPFKTYTWNHDQWIMPGTEDTDSPKLGGKGQYFQWEFDIKKVSLSFDNEIESGDNITSLHRGEVYRYGVILYDEYGLASSPKFIADIMVPPASEFPIVDSFTSSGAVLNRVGIKFSLVQSLVDKGVYGWEIVRCNRSYKDKLTLFQGLCSLPLRSYKDFTSSVELKPWNVDWSWRNEHFSSLQSLSTLYTGGFWSMQYYRDAWNSVGNAAYSDPETLMFACPEFCYMEADTQNLIGDPKGKSLVFEPSAFYTIPLYQNPRGSYTYIRSTKDTVDGPSVASFKYRSTEEEFGSETSTIKPGADLLWLDAYGPERASSTGIQYSWDYISYSSPFRDCILIEFKNANDKIQYAAFYHITPTGVCDIDDSINTNTKIRDCSFVDVPEDQYKSFSKTTGENTNLTFTDHSTNIGDKNFINWLASGMDYEGYEGQMHTYIVDGLTTSNENIREKEKNHGYITSDTIGVVRYAATGGKCMLFSTELDLSFGYYNSESPDNIFPICIGNIKNANAIPYNGSSDQSKLNSVYYGDGNFTKGSELSVFDGDTYLCMFTYNAAHCFIDETLWNVPRVAIIYTTPIESSINLKARSGYLYQDIQNKNDMSRFIQDYPVNILLYNEDYVQSDYAYIYNAAYDSLPNVIKYIPVYYNSVSSNTYDNRIHYTSPKEDNQTIDLWFSTASGASIDVDSRYGAITGMRLFKDKLIFWQERATGLLTVNEKTVVSNTENGNIILADNPGVVQRYDYISTKYGMKKGQHTDAQSDNALYWWDSDNKELLLYSNGLVPLSKAHFVENYINEREESTKPCVGYYCDFDEIFANVRRNNNNGETLVFNEKLNMFTSVYTFNPSFMLSIGNAVYLAKPRTADERARMYMMTPSKNEANTVLFGSPAYPTIEYVVNNLSTFVKTFDILTFGGNFYGGGGHGERSTNLEDNPDLRLYPRVTLNGNDNSILKYLKLSYATPLNQSALISGDRMSNREYDFRLNIPRNGDNRDWGDRLRGKTMQCTIKSDSNSKNFSLQYVITKYRMSWS